MTDATTSSPHGYVEVDLGPRTDAGRVEERSQLAGQRVSPSDRRKHGALRVPSQDPQTGARRQPSGVLTAS